MLSISILAGPSSFSPTSQAPSWRGVMSFGMRPRAWSVWLSQFSSERSDKDIPTDSRDGRSGCKFNEIVRGFGLLGWAGENRTAAAETAVDWRKRKDAMRSWNCILEMIWLKEEERK